MRVVGPGQPSVRNDPSSTATSQMTILAELERALVKDKTSIGSQGVRGGACSAGVREAEMDGVASDWRTRDAPPRTELKVGPAAWIVLAQPLHHQPCRRSSCQACICPTTCPFARRSPGAAPHQGNAREAFCAHMVSIPPFDPIHSTRPNLPYPQCTHPFLLQYVHPNPISPYGRAA